MDESTLALIDAAVGDRVLAYGSLPPEARDLDLLVRRPERRAVETALRDAGFVHQSDVWARFAECRASAVDLADAESWRLPAHELDALFADAVPLDGYSKVVRPSAHHTLLILARRAATQPLGEKQRRRLEAAIGEDADAWARARTRASAWDATDALTALERGEQHAPAHAHVRRAARVARRTARGRVVCLSGLDGAGKSGQATALQDALRAVGVEAVVEWLPFGQNPTIERASEVARTVLRLLSRFGPAGRLEERTSRGESLLAVPGSTPRRGAAGRAALFAWTTIVALANASHQRRTVTAHAARGRVVIFDRYTLDSVVRLRYLYGDDERFRFQSLLIRIVSPKPCAAFFLDVAPETALARKEDRWSLDDLRRQSELYREEAARLGVVRLDGERPREELCAQIAAEVWSALG